MFAFKTGNSKRRNLVTIIARFFQLAINRLIHRRLQVLIGKFDFAGLDFGIERGFFFDGQLIVRNMRRRQIDQLIEIVG